MQDLPPPPPPEYSTYRKPGTVLGLPVWGCVLIGCGCSILPAIAILAAILFPVFAQARESGRAASCMSNVKQMALAHLMYCQDYDEKFAPSERWMDLTTAYIKQEAVFHCPGVPGFPQPYGYAYDSDLSKKSQGDIPELKTAIMLYDSRKLGRSESDRAASFPYPGRHRLRNSIGYADGHVKLRPQGTETDPDPSPH